MDQQLKSRKFDRFVHNLSRSGLIVPDDLAERLRAFHDRPEAEQPYPTALTNLGSWLVGQGLLTCWQYTMLCDGKWKGFFMDEYKLLDHLETNDAGNVYLAQRVATGTRVAIRVAFPALAKVPGKIEYQIVHEFS